MQFQFMPRSLGPRVRRPFRRASAGRWRCAWVSSSGVWRCGWTLGRPWPGRWSAGAPTAASRTRTRSTRTGARHGPTPTSAAPAATAPCSGRAPRSSRRRGWTPSPARHKVRFTGLDWLLCYCLLLGCWTKKNGQTRHFLYILTRSCSKFFNGFGSFVRFTITVFSFTITVFSFKVFAEITTFFWICKLSFRNFPAMKSFGLLPMSISHVIGVISYGPIVTLAVYFIS